MENPMLFRPARWVAQPVATGDSSNRAKVNILIFLNIDKILVTDTS